MWFYCLGTTFCFLSSSYYVYFYVGNSNPHSISDQSIFRMHMIFLGYSELDICINKLRFRLVFLKIIIIIIIKIIKALIREAQILLKIN